MTDKQRKIEFKGKTFEFVKEEDINVGDIIDLTLADNDEKQSILQLKASMTEESFKNLRGLSIKEMKQLMKKAEGFLAK